MRYRNPRAAARWLCEVFGFSEHETVESADGRVRYVLLQLGTSFVMVLPVADHGFDDLVVHPQALGGANTQVCYVTVADPQAHRARAELAGARIEIEPQDDGLGGQFYTCRDLEGHLWSFGNRTYGLTDPAGAGQWNAIGAGPSRPSNALTVLRSRRRSAGGVLLRLTAAVAVVAVVAVGGWTVYRNQVGAASGSAVQVEGVLEQLARERERLAAAESASKDAAADLAEQRAVTGDLRRALLQAETELQSERRRKDEAAAAVGSLQATAAELEQAGRRAQTELAAAREKVAQEEARAKSAAGRTAALEAETAKLRQEHAAGQDELRKAREALALAHEQARAKSSAAGRTATLEAEIAKLQQERAGEQDELGKAREALAGAQAALEALRASATPDAGAEKAGLPPTAVADQPGVEKSAPAEPRKLQGLGAADLATGSVTVPEPPEATAPKSACAQAVQGKVPFGRKASSVWAEANLARLCRGAETSPEPARCFEELMRGKVSWGGGTAWTTPNALALCAGSRNARQTLDCFAEKLAADETWKAAIKGCKSG